MKRIESIDITRGIVMIIMALDHVRDLMHVNSITQSPTNLETTTPLLFFTRWITYLCAPIFVFLAGTSVYLSLKKKNNISFSRNFLLKRGIFLILLELVVVNFLLFFDQGYHTILFEVIAAIGFGFIVLGLLLNVSSRTIGIIGLVILFCHNLVPLEEGSTGKTILRAFFQQTAFPLPLNRVIVIAYPPIPWLAIMLLGFASGRFFEWTEQRRFQLFIRLGFFALILFVAIRAINIYGDPVTWSIKGTAMFTFLSFMNVTKYPPSLQFCLITLGIMFFMLAFSEKSMNRFFRIASVYGKVPLFYFLVHFFLIHLLLLGLLFLQGITWSQMDFASGSFGRPQGMKSGVSLWMVYLIWMGVVVVLYRPCLWFMKYKARHTQWWLKYI